MAPPTAPSRRAGTDGPGGEGVLDIGEVAARTGVAPSALRYYERLGLIESTARHGLRRQYRPEVLEALGIITLCRRSGFRLSEIGALMATGGREGWKDLVDRKRRELRAQIEVLSAMADDLDHAMACPSPNVLDCRRFRRHVRAALPAEAEPETQALDRSRKGPSTRSGGSR